MCVCLLRFGIGFTLPLTRSSPSRHPPFTQYPSPSRSLVCDGQTSPHKPRLVVPHSTCPSLSPSNTHVSHAAGRRKGSGAATPTRWVAGRLYLSILPAGTRDSVCVLLLQDLLQSCARGGRRRVEDMCYERRRAEACVDESAHHAHVLVTWWRARELKGC
jgi:hypothetical protein